MRNCNGLPRFARNDRGFARNDTNLSLRGALRRSNLEARQDYCRDCHASLAMTKRVCTTDSDRWLRYDQRP